MEQSEKPLEEAYSKSVESVKAYIDMILNN